MGSALARVCFGLPWYAFTGGLTVFGQAPGSGVISGIVLDGDTNTPVRRAIVTLSTVEARPQDAVAWSDAGGRFAFGYLPAGRYQVRAHKTGYQPVAFGSETPYQPGAILTLAAGENRGGVAMRLRHFGAISGMVLDEDGDPVAGVQVSALAPGFQRRKRTLLPRSAATTDSRGRYWLSTLPAGRYAVMVRPSFRPALRAQPESMAGPVPQNYMYGVQFCSGADRGSSAAL